MQGKVCVITGASSGIGLATAEAMGKLGYRLVLVGRNKDRCDAALHRLHKAVPGLEARFHHADLSILEEMRRVGDEIAATEPKIHVLINNAGTFAARRIVTGDGLERMFAVNHMSYFVVTDRLKHAIAAAAPARIVNVASVAHRGQKLDFADLQSERKFSGMTVYGRSKLANILFTRELSRRMATTGTTANSLHPGFIASSFGNGSGPVAGPVIGVLKALFGKRPERGAETPVYLATSPTLADTTGHYFENCREVLPSAAAQDDQAAHRLWDESARLAGLDR